MMIVMMMPFMSNVKTTILTSIGNDIQQLMNTTRQASLIVPLDDKNIGFKLMKRIGYEEGKGLGKDAAGE
jgi:hypothetical protein